MSQHSQHSPHSPHSSHPQSAPPAQRPPRLVVAEGDSTAIGTAVGAETRELIASSLDTYERRFRDDAQLSNRDIQRWGEIYLEVARSYHPRIGDMIAGLAAGAEVAPWRIAALNARTEMLYGTGYREGGCTSAAVMPEATADGHTLVGQNWDWRPEQLDSSFILATRDETGHATIALTEAGMFMKSGVNSAGLAACANLLVSDRDRGGRGVPYHYLLRGALESKTMSELMTRVLPVQRISSGNLMLGDAGGEIIDIELAPEDFGVIYPSDGVLAHANHFESDVPVRDLKRQSSALTMLRSHRARRLLAAKRGSLTRADMVAVFRDTYSWPDSICREPNTALPEPDRFATLYSIVMDLDERSFSIARYPIRDTAYWTWNLDEVFDRPDATPEFVPDATEGAP